MARRRYRLATPLCQPTGSWAIALDRRLARTLTGQPLQMPCKALAAAVAKEWNDQGEQIRPQTMPFTRLVMNSNDQVAPHRERIGKDLLRYSHSDLVCYRANEPEALVQRQQRFWQPLVDWAALELKAKLVVTSGVMPVPQPPEACLALAQAVEALDAFCLTALAMATGASGSLIVALALVHGRMEGDEAFELCQLDESYQIEQWGEDREAAEKRAALRADLRDIARFLRLLQEN